MVTRTSSTGSEPTIQDGAVWGLDQGINGGERNTTSLVNNYTVIKEEANFTILSNATANIIGAGAADDTFLMGITILANGVAVTATIAGFADQAGAAANLVLTGSTTTDLYYHFPARRNSKGALTITASVASKVGVDWRPV